MNSFMIGKHKIEKFGEPFFMPDIGTFFNQDMSKAEELVYKLKDAGCTLIKGELLHNSDICLDTEILEKYYSPSTGTLTEKYKSLIERKVVPIESYEKLFKLIKNLDLDFLVSVYDFEGADYAKQWGASALKIATSNITHIPLIRYVANLGLPVILDTGRSNWDEIARAIQTVKETGNEKLLVEHSPYAPPAPLDQQNLRMMESLEKAFDVNVGLSDHHSTEEMLYATIAMGFQSIEKGICFDDNEVDQGVYHALPIGMVKEVLEKCRNIHDSMGSGTRFLLEEQKKKTDRMCLVAKKDLNNGDIINFENITFSFPELGIPAYEWDTVADKTINRSIKKGEIIGWDDVDISAK